MSSASNMFHFFTAKDRELFQKLAKKLNEDQEEYDAQAKQTSFKLWAMSTQQLRKIAQDEEQRQQVISVLKNSTRGQRSTMEKEILRRFIIQHLTCIPKNISFSEMDQLCNEVDWYPIIGRSIIFLQGDFGNVYYMIAGGTVGLYLEPSKDREMIIAREFGSLRAQPYHGTNDELKGLGINILNLPKGAGFGEYAILATTNKIRSCAVVSVANDSLLMIMHAETYNAVLRQHHYRQKQLSSATALLSELPLFKHLNFSKIASIAYTMKSQTYSSGSVIVRPGQVINNVMLVVSGQIKVYAPPATSSHLHGEPGAADGKFNQHSAMLSARTKASTMLLQTYQHNVNKIIEKRIPRLAISILGRGQIIGEMETAKGLRNFLNTYESCAAGTEVLEMPATIFKENLQSPEFKASYLYKSIEAVNQEKEARRQGRLSRAYVAMRQMMEGPSKQEKTREQLMHVLPMVLDPSLSEAAVDSLGHSGLQGSFHGIPGVNRRLSMLPMFGSTSQAVTLGHDDTDVKVTRRASYDPRQSTGQNTHSSHHSHSHHSHGGGHHGDRMQMAMRQAVSTVLHSEATAPATTAVAGQDAASSSLMKSSQLSAAAPTAPAPVAAMSAAAPPQGGVKKSQVLQSPRKLQFSAVTPS